jgi:hypothetical protein
MRNAMFCRTALISASVKAALAAAIKQFCHPERFSVKDLHFVLKRNAGGKANAGPSLESVQDDSVVCSPS